MTAFLTEIKNIIWGIPLIVTLLGVGIYFTYKLKLIQLTKLKLAFKCIFKKEDGEGDVSSFQSLCTALSSTIGTGNIVGVATAILTGGPGALLWMWVAAFFGMATKYAEGLLAIVFREKDGKGNYAGGPMYYLKNGLHSNILANSFAIFTVLAALLGIGTFSQVKSISSGLHAAIGMPKEICSIILVVLVAAITLGGIKRIASVSEKVVPFMSFFYILGVIIVLCVNITNLPNAILLIIESAFNPRAALGSGAGLTIIMVMQRGVSRGIFSNEAGLGSAPIAAASAKTNSCVRQGLVSMTGTFIDTIIICTMTGLAIVVTGAFNTNLVGGDVTTWAFESALPIAGIGTFIVNVGLIFFAFTTVIGWNFYGEQCIQFIGGDKAILPYKILFIICVGIGPFISLDMVFIIADILNGLMAIPNLIGLIGLRNIIITETQTYFEEDEVSSSLLETNS
ncbi:MAG: sodium:alanine symporter family protein [Thomasclavelia sp.]|nr:sodium:alanine symporter family protein [Thomasclavelia sp.]